MAAQDTELSPSNRIASAGAGAPRRFALLGNPNTGKTSLFNQLCGIRAKTANFPGSTVEARIGTCARAGVRHEVIDLPGHYGLNLDRPESRFCKAFLAGAAGRARRPDTIIVVADATNLPRSLILVSQALQQGLPALVALTMIDIAQRRGLSIDTQALGRRIGCPVVAVSGRTGEGVDALLDAMAAPRLSDAELPDPTDAHAAAAWADRVIEESLGGAEAVGLHEDTLTDRLDAAFTHPVLGVLVFAAVMTGLFYTIFTLATVPMDLIELLFERLGAWAGVLLPAGPIRAMVVDGIVGGVAGTLVFLPQICLLFFLISLLEDTGYLARAAFVMDRFLRRFGLPGQAFVPLLSAHACALPAIMSARLIPDHRDRIATILVAPFMSCSARLPVYVLIIGILFGDHPLLTGLAFTGCYVLGAVTALVAALLVRRTILRGPARPMVLELPGYKWPSLRNAVFGSIDRAVVFLRKAGTTILAICVVLWWLGTYPQVEPPPAVLALRASAAGVSDVAGARVILAEADALEAAHAKAHSFIGRIGRCVEPAFRPLGYDWQLSIGVLSSFMAREVFVSTMAVVLSSREGDDSADAGALRARIADARRSDGSALFTPATSASLLVFYVLAMQCLPTLAVTRRETGTWKWAMLQLAGMSALAYVCALSMRLGLTALGVD